MTGIRDGRVNVFPAYAGMSLLNPSIDAGRVSFPRLRGDEPAYADTAASTVGFSPPTRG